MTRTLRAKLARVEALRDGGPFLTRWIDGSRLIDLADLNAALADPEPEEGAMSSELVYRAANLLRERVNAATPGKWRPSGKSIGNTVKGCTCAGPIPGYPQHEQHCGIEGPIVEAHETDIAYIATMQPEAGLELAELLDALAYDREQGDVDGSTWDHHVMPLARLIASDAS